MTHSKGRCQHAVVYITTMHAQLQPPTMLRLSLQFIVPVICVLLCTCLAAHTQPPHHTQVTSQLFCDRPVHVAAHMPCCTRPAHTLHTNYNHPQTQPVGGTGFPQTAQGCCGISHIDCVLSFTSLPQSQLCTGRPLATCHLQSVAVVPLATNLAI